MLKKKKSLGGCDKVSPVVPESDACLSLRSFVFFIYSSFLSFLCFTPVFVNFQKKMVVSQPIMHCFYGMCHSGLSVHFIVV